jgi:predicted KAP-like P-loop ATPase
MNNPTKNASNPGQSEHPFSSERPIGTLGEDELGRKGFAAAIAKVIGSWTGRESLVVAIYGPWGSGKTSLKNMILDALPKENANTIPLEFNPWEWAGQQKVFEGFFDELSSKLGSVDASNEAANAAKKMRMYGTMLLAAGSITGRFRWLLIGLLAAVGFFGLAPLVHSPRLLNTVSILAGLAFLAAITLATSGDTTNRIAAYLAAKAEATHKSVADIKRDLHGLLEGLSKNVLVVLDDVDRLTPEGIRLVFQLVKANADFPNLVYVLLFQRDTIERALGRMDRAGELDGGEFLQKVVQVGFDIPKLSPQKLEESLELVISRLVEETPAESRFDSRRWAGLLASGIRPYFQTLRDVKRFSNTLSFHFELYRNGDTFDANPVDLIGLEVLRQFEAGARNC